MLIGEASRGDHTGGHGGLAILGPKEYFFTFLVKNKMLRARNAGYTCRAVSCNLRQSPGFLP
jgi:hypothetical protein